MGDAGRKGIPGEQVCARAQRETHHISCLHTLCILMSVTCEQSVSGSDTLSNVCVCVCVCARRVIKVTQEGLERRVTLETLERREDR